MIDFDALQKQFTCIIHDYTHGTGQWSQWLKSNVQADPMDVPRELRDTLQAASACVEVVRRALGAADYAARCKIAEAKADEAIARAEKAEKAHKLCVAATWIIMIHDNQDMLTDPWDALTEAANEFGEEAVRGKLVEVAVQLNEENPHEVVDEILEIWRDGNESVGLG